MRKRKRKRQVTLERAYEPKPSENGCRVLVDRLWPRGIKKEDLALDAWMKDLAPSSELRHWFNHDPKRWEKFLKRYFAELDAKPEAIAQLVDTAKERPIILVYGARDERHNNAIALKEYLLQTHERDFE